MGVGFDGATIVEDNAFPDRFGALLSTIIGVPQAGSGIVPATMSSGRVSDRWTISGAVSTSAYPGFAVIAANGSMTFTSHQKGTSVEIYHGDWNSSFTVQIDARAPFTVAAGSGAGNITKTSPAVAQNLTDDFHTVKILSAGNVPLTGVAVQRASGIAVHNLGMGGATAGGNVGPAKSLTDTSRVASLNKSRRGMLESSGMSIDLVILCLGSNDIAAGASVADTLAALTEIRGWLPDVDHVFVGAWELRGLTNMTTWAEYVAARYTFADDADIPFLDWLAMFGDGVTTFDAGMAGPDGLHPNVGTEREFARTLANLYV